MSSDCSMRGRQSRLRARRAMLSAWSPIRSGPGVPRAPLAHDGRCRSHPGGGGPDPRLAQPGAIADHATNIAEDVIYIVRGEDVRERGDKEVRKGLRAPGAGPPR